MQAHLTELRARMDAARKSMEQTQLQFQQLLQVSHLLGGSWNDPGLACACQPHLLTPPAVISSPIPSVTPYVLVWRCTGV